MEGMQGQPVNGVGFGAVAVIARDGAAQVREVDSDLVFAAGFKPDFKQGIKVVCAFFQDFVVSD